VKFLIYVTHVLFHLLCLRLYEEIEWDPCRSNACVYAFKSGFEKKDVNFFAVWKILIVARTSLLGALNKVLRRYLGPNSLSRKTLRCILSRTITPVTILQPDTTADKSGEFGKIK